MNANIRCYTDVVEGTTKLFLEVMGSAPDQVIHILVVGWY